MNYEWIMIYIYILYLIMRLIERADDLWEFVTYPFSFCKKIRSQSKVYCCSGARRGSTWMYLCLSKALMPRTWCMLQFLAKFQVLFWKQNKKSQRFVPKNPVVCCHRRTRCPTFIYHVTCTMHGTLYNPWRTWTVFGMWRLRSIYRMTGRP